VARDRLCKLSISNILSLLYLNHSGYKVFL
jgi:hypothetical protein